jgi:hypothetical protein
MTTPGKFSTPRFEVQSSQFQPNLLIVDYDYWTANEYEIKEWMAANLPRGIHHQFGMLLNFEKEQDRLAFLMRWGP